VIKFLDLHRQYENIKPEIDAAIASVIKDSAFIGGKYVAAFEASFGQYQQVKYCVGVGNGTDAIQIALEALDLPQSSEVIVPANTFIATAEAVTSSGHKVVFCDCDPYNYTIAVKDLRKRITPRTHAIIPVHLYGHPCDMDAILEIARQYGLKVIEDCAQAHGAEYKGRRVGGIGDIGIFSFYPGKNLGAYGDAGAIVTNDDKIANKCRMIANHGRMEKYNHLFEGRNSRLDGIQASILQTKLKHLNEWTEKRIEIAGIYRRELQGVEDIVLPRQEEWARQVYHLFVIRTPHRDHLKAYLAKNQIETGIHYPIALPKLQAYAYLHQNEEPMQANTLDDQLLSLPMGEHLSEADIKIVTAAIRAGIGALKQ